MDFIHDIIDYNPQNEQEEMDREFFLRYADRNPDCLQRENDTAHFTSSGWIVNKNHSKVLLIWHNIYKSWSWTGGHADGNPDLSIVALKEALEETGLSNIVLESNKPVSLESIAVNGHFKNGIYLHSHLHLNLTYILNADENEFLHIKEDENSDVQWFTIDDALKNSSEPWMVNSIYQKLIHL